MGGKRGSTRAPPAPGQLPQPRIRRLCRTLNKFAPSVRAFTAKPQRLDVVSFLGRMETTSHRQSRSARTEGVNPVNKAFLASLVALVAFASVAPALAAPPNFPARSDSSSSVNRGGDSNETAYQGQHEEKAAK